MTLVRNRLLLLFLEEPELKTDDSLLKRYKEVFGDNGDGSEAFETIRELTRHGELVDFDPELEALDESVWITHKEHGDLDFNDVEITGIDSFLALGPKSIISITQNVDELAEVAIQAGFSKALAHLQNLPINSNDWTGLPNGFRFTPPVQAKVIENLKKARAELSSMALDNVRHAKASAYIECALMMAELPEPEPDLVAVMINRLLLIVGIVGVFADLKEIFT